MIFSYALDLKRPKSEWWFRFDDHIIRVDQIVEAAWNDSRLVIILKGNRVITKEDILEDDFKQMYKILCGVL